MEKTQNGRKAEFRYDYFGRLAEKHEEGLSTFYRYDAWGNRTARVTRTSTGLELAEERTYDRYGRLTEIRSDGKSVKYEYDRENRLARQIIDNIPVDFEYTKYNQLAAKYFGGKLQPVSTLRYFYAPDGTIVAREVGGELQRYTYDKRGQLLAVLDAQNRPVEQYTYDKAGNILEKFTNGVRTTFTYDKANQLVSSVDSKGNSKKYAYDAAGRLVKEGDRVYQYGWLDKVTQITEGDKVIRSFRYHMDGQLAAAYDDSSTETFLWDGLALIRRDTTNYLNEPAVTGGNPVIAGEKTLFNDLLGSTLGAKSADGFSAIERDAFGEVKPGETADLGINFFTGKPQVEGLGYTFLFRNYRPDQGKWQTADPLGYPDGWNNLAYVNNGVTMAEQEVPADLVTKREAAFKHLVECLAEGGELFRPEFRKDTDSARGKRQRRVMILHRFVPEEVGFPQLQFDAGAETGERGEIPAADRHDESRVRVEAVETGIQLLHPVLHLRRNRSRGQQQRGGEYSADEKKLIHTPESLLSPSSSSGTVSVLSMERSALRRSLPVRSACRLRWSISPPRDGGYGRFSVSVRNRPTGISAREPDFRPGRGRSRCRASVCRSRSIRRRAAGPG